MATEDEEKERLKAFKKETEEELKKSIDKVQTRGAFTEVLTTFANNPKEVAELATALIKLGAAGYIAGKEITKKKD